MIAETVAVTTVVTVAEQGPRGLGYESAAAQAATESARDAAIAAAAATAEDRVQTGIDAANAGASAELAADWAEKTDGPVTGDQYSAKYWANHENVQTVSDIIEEIQAVAAIDAKSAMA